MALARPSTLQPCRTRPCVQPSCGWRQWSSTFRCLRSGATCRMSATSALPLGWAWGAASSWGPWPPGRSYGMCRWAGAGGSTCGRPLLWGRCLEHHSAAAGGSAGGQAGAPMQEQRQCPEPLALGLRRRAAAEACPRAHHATTGWPPPCLVPPPGRAARAAHAGLLRRDDVDHGAPQAPAGPPRRAAGHCGRLPRRPAGRGGVPAGGAGGRLGHEARGETPALYGGRGRALSKVVNQVYCSSTQRGGARKDPHQAALPSRGL